MKPPRSLPSASVLDSAADELASTLNGLDDLVTNVIRTWKDLPACYRAPEAETVYNAMDPLLSARDGLASSLGDAVTALREYADELRSLEIRRATLMADIETIAKDSNHPLLDRGPRAEGVQETIRARRSFDSDVAAAEERCSSALRRLRLSGTWLAHDYLNIVEGNTGSVAQGVAGEILQRYRGMLLLPGPNAEMPPAYTFTPSHAHPDWPRELIDGEVHVHRPDRFVLPESSLPASALPETERPPGWRGVPQLTPAEVGNAPAWAGHAASGLNVLGVALTYLSVYSDSYIKTLTHHPDWEEAHRRSEATVDSLVVGSTSVVMGGVLGWEGAAIGAAIGSILPGPGTVIGGIVGGVIGGFAGGWAGETAADAFMDGVRGEEPEGETPAIEGGPSKENGGNP